MAQNNSFAKIMIAAVDQGLLLLGESARRAIYFRLGKDCTLARDEIAGDPEALAEGLERIFGVGAQVVERSIVKSLYSNLGLKCEEAKDFNFVQAVRKTRFAWPRGNDAQKQYLQKQSLRSHDEALGHYDQLLRYLIFNDNAVMAAATANKEIAKRVNSTD